MKGVRVNKPMDWDRLECIECTSSPDWLGIIYKKNYNPETFYICNDCKMEYYEKTL